LGDRIPVTILLAKRIEGRSEEDLARAYHISTETIMDAAVREMLTVSKEAVLKHEAKEKRQREKRRVKKSHA